MDFADKQTKMKKGYSPQAVKIVVRAKCSVAFSLTPTLHLEGSIPFSFSVCWLSKVILLAVRENVAKNSRKP